MYILFIKNVAATLRVRGGQGIGNEGLLRGQSQLE